MPQIHRAVRNAVRDQLKDVNNGFNKKLADIASTYDIADQVFTINFDNPGENFYYGQISEEVLDALEGPAYPLMTLFSIASGNQNFQKFTTFSGTVEIGIQVFVSWAEGRLIPNFENLGDAVIDVMYDLFNASALQSWAVPVAYNGEISCAKGPLVLAGDNWRQLLIFRLVFQVDA